MASPYLHPPTCANIDGDWQCPNDAGRLVCSRCRLVQYCSGQCQKAHWPVHKVETCQNELMSQAWKPSWFKELRAPFQPPPGTDPLGLPFNDPNRIKKLWGNMPAIDILKVDTNEGTAARETDFRILCAASGDLRNMVKTVNDLPDDYTGRCTFVANDFDLDIVARNTILLMIAQHIPVEEAVPVMIHLWYSARLPTTILDVIQNTILPLVEDVCTKIANKPDTVPLGKTFKITTGQSIRIVLTKSDWNRFKAYFTLPAGLNPDTVRAMRQNAVYNPARRDNLHKGFYTFWPALRMCADKFRRDGILLPYGASRTDFVAWNPTFLQAPGLWPFRHDVEPSAGWSYEQIMTGAPRATNDYLGAQFNMLRDLLTKFCTRVQNFDVHFRLYYMDCRQLPSRLVQWKEDIGLYDRIEVCKATTLLLYVHR